MKKWIGGGSWTFVARKNEGGGKNLPPPLFFGRGVCLTVNDIDHTCVRYVMFGTNLYVVLFLL